MFFKSGRSTADETKQPEAAGLAAFASEADVPSEANTPSQAGGKQQKQRFGRLFLWSAVILLGGSAAAAGTWQYKRWTPAPSAFLSVETSVPGLDVTVADKPVGRTPVEVWLQPGTYAVVVGRGAQRREMQVTLAAGASVYRQLDVAVNGADGSARAAADTQLRIETEPAGMLVAIDGVERGASPITVESLPAGEHDVVVRGGGRTLRNTVATRAGERAVVMFASDARAQAAPATTAAPLAAGGWLAVSSAFPVQIREGGKVVGSSELERLMLPTGDHALEFVNEALGYRTRRVVKVAAGKTATVQLERVNGVLSINALPWAEVWVDGERVGHTPIGNLSRPIGTHDVVLRHPQLGERRERVTITAQQPTRLGVDLRKGK